MGFESHFNSSKVRLKERLQAHRKRLQAHFNSSKVRLKECTWTSEDLMDCISIPVRCD